MCFSKTKVTDAYYTRLMTAIYLREGNEFPRHGAAYITLTDTLCCHKSNKSFAMKEPFPATMNLPILQLTLSA